VFCGLDVGETVHHACALDPAGGRLYDRPLPNDEAFLDEVFTQLSAHGNVLVILDQPASIGALAVAAARSLGIEVAYLPGLAMRRIADLHPGQGKTDARDAYVIADAARTMPHTLRHEVAVLSHTNPRPRRLRRFDPAPADDAARSVATAGEQPLARCRP
jgi:hypothetical protein